MKSKNQNNNKKDEKYEIFKESNQKQSNEINFIIRNLENNTHEVIGDTKLKRITSWRKSKTKFMKNLIYNILSFGILHLISLYYPNLYIKLYCNPWPAKECDFFLVENIYGQYTLCEKIHKKNNDSSNSNSEIAKENFLSPLKNINLKTEYNIIKNLTYSFIYKSVTYEYIEENNEIIPVYINLSNMTNKGILNFFGEGLFSEKLVNKFKERYGKNEYNIDIKLPFLYFRKNEIPSFIIIFLIGIIEIILQDYISFIIKTAIVFIIFIIEYINMKNIILDKYSNEYSLDGDKIKIKVKRKYLNELNNNFYIEIDNIDLLPGDIIYLKSNDFVPCDCILIEGECIVSESYLTGNLDVFRKIPLENNNDKFNYKSNKINILFHGMKIIKAFSKPNNEFISALCINIGPNTYKANQFSNILYYFERKKEYNNVYSYFGNRKKIIFIYMIFAFIMSFILGIFFSFTFDMELGRSKVRELILRILLRNLCKSLMSVYFITNSILVLVNIIRLKNKSIICFDKSRLFNSDKINTIVFSKVDTLCKDILEINGYHPIFFNSKKASNLIIKNYNRNQCKELNLELIKYYKEYFNNKQNISYNNMNFNLRKELRIDNINKINQETCEYTILFIECLLSCNNIEKCNTELFGNNLEVSFFNDMKWDIKVYDFIKNNIDNSYVENNNSFLTKISNDKFIFDNNKNIIYYQISDIYPKSYYIITESLKIDSSNQINFQRTRNNSKYIREFGKRSNKELLLYNHSSKKDNSINNKVNKILEDVSHSNINSYKLRIYKKFIKEGTINSSSIVYNFMTKELRFMIKGMPEDILDKCNKKSLPENLENIILNYRKNGFIIITCASKLINIFEYNDTNDFEYYMNNLTFCGFITLKNQLKNEIKNSIQYLNQFNCNLIMTSGDNVYNCLGVGFDCGIIDNKNIFVFDKDDKTNKISIRKIFTIKSYNEIYQENEDKKTNDSYDRNSKVSSKIRSKKGSTLPFTISKDKILLKSNNSPTLSPESMHKSGEQNINKIQSPKMKLGTKFLLNKIDNVTIKQAIDDEKNKFNKKSKNEKESSFREFHLNSDYKNEEKANNSKKRYSKVVPSPLISPYIKKKSNNRIKDRKKEEKNSFNLNESFDFRNHSGSKNKYLFILDKYYYYSGIFKENEELKKNCLYCVSGKLFHFLYKNKKNKECKNFLELIHKYCKIFFYMSAIDKSLLIDFFREYSNDYICKIGNCQNDFDSLLSSNVGISLKEPKNQNNLLCHFYVTNSDILSIKNIILEGRVFNENMLLLEMASFFCTLSINSYILCCFIRRSDAIKGQLNFIEIIFCLLSILAFNGKPNYKLELEPIAKNKNILNKYYIVQFAGLLIIKFLSIYIFCYYYNTDLLLDRSKVDFIFCSYYFIIVIEHIMSSIFFFNYISFNKKSPGFNFFFMFFILILALYIVILITLNSSNFKFDFIQITYFEYFEVLIDSYGDNNRIYVFIACTFDFISSIFFTEVTYYIFDKIAKNKLSVNDKK